MYMIKTTKKEMFAFLLQVVADSDKDCKDMLIEFINNEISLIDKKVASKKPTKTQELNECIKSELSEILGTLEDGATISELQAEENFTEYSNQKLSALLNQMVKDGLVQKTVAKNKKTIFSLVRQ